MADHPLIYRPCPAGWEVYMPVYKDTKTGLWYVKCYYTDYTGQKKQKMKRGFKLQRDAKDWERLFLEQFARSPNITFETLYKKYLAYITPRIRESTLYKKKSVTDLHILPYFKKRIVSEITPEDVVTWQTSVMSLSLSDTYMRTINADLNAILNYAVDYVGLPKNPCKRSMGSSKSRPLNYWTPEEYKRFIDCCHNNLQYYTLFETLYYTGMRIGEALALTLNDIDWGSRTISISKTLYNLPGKKLIGPPKTSQSNRVIDAPAFLIDELQEYISHLYQPDPEASLFSITASAVRVAINRYAHKAGVKQIRVHDLRHSHASMLINLGANPLLVSERLGHESPDITMKTYAHLFPSTQRSIVDKITKI